MECVTYGLLLLDGGAALGASLLLALALHQQGLGHQDFVLGRDGPARDMSVDLRASVRCALWAKKCGTVVLLALMHSPLHTRKCEIER